MAGEDVAADELRLPIERIERLEEKKAIADDVRAVHSEAKPRGYEAPSFGATWPIHQ